MKKSVLFTSLMVIIATAVYSQAKNYKVVFDMTSKDTLNQQSVVRQVNLIKGTSPDATLQVVIYGQGLDFVVKGRSAQETALEKILASKKASFKVCEMTLKRNNIEKGQLIAGVEIVPDGIYEIISRQQEGWGYIKVGH